jgi:hypothetical protein
MRYGARTRRAYEQPLESTLMRSFIFLALFVLSLAAAACSDSSDSSNGSETEIDLLTAGSTDPVLDGAAEVDPNALADLARDRALLGGHWLNAVAQTDGSFHYVYDADDDEYETDEYNEVRHAGTTYALFQLYAITGDQDILAAAEGGARYIDENSIAVSDLGRAFVYDDRMKLGGQGLAIVALVERRRALADGAYDALIDDLARFMRLMARPDLPGAYFNSYDLGVGPSVEPDSDFYPGESLLAFARLAVDDPGGPNLQPALAAAEYLVHVKDGDVPVTREIADENHWLVLALSELYRVQTTDAYKDVAYLHADSIVASQWGADGGVRSGASQNSDPVSFTSTATKGEALIAAWELALRAGDVDRAETYASAARRNAQFSMRVQYLDANAELFPNPPLLRGGWASGPDDYDVRIDYVQHNVSVLVGLWRLTQQPHEDRPAGQ